MPTNSHGYLAKTLDRTTFLRMRSNLHMHYLLHSGPAACTVHVRCPLPSVRTSGRIHVHVYGVHFSCTIKDLSKPRACVRTRHSYVSFVNRNSKRKISLQIRQIHVESNIRNERGSQVKSQGWYWHGGTCSLNTTGLFFSYKNSENTTPVFKSNLFVSASACNWSLYATCAVHSLYSIHLIDERSVVSFAAPWRLYHGCTHVTCSVQYMYSTCTVRVHVPSVTTITCVHVCVCQVGSDYRSASVKPLLSNGW